MDNLKLFLLPTDFKERGAFAKIGKTLNAIGRLLNGLHFEAHGDVLTTSQAIRLRIPKAPTFSGTAYVAGVKTTGLNSDPSKGWVMVNLSSGTAVQVASGQVPASFPANLEFYEKSKTYGDIHVLRA